ncbi:MAG TPA: hypothetical protein VMU65_11390 [Candidatus Saccharimonadales bacterium]|nr:hypothetical protein [Candidatus Saccharimonadales bacterium]
MPLNVAGTQLSNGALAFTGGLTVGTVSTFFSWHGTAIASAPQATSA